MSKFGLGPMLSENDDSREIAISDHGIVTDSAGMVLPKNLSHERELCVRPSGQGSFKIS